MEDYEGRKETLQSNTSLRVCGFRVPVPYVMDLSQDCRLCTVA